MLLGLRVPRKEKAPTPTFRQLGTLIGSLLLVAVGESAQTAALSQASTLPTAPSTKTSTSPILHLVDEKLPSEEETVPLKRRRVKVDSEAVRNEEPTRGDPEPATVAPVGGMDLVAELCLL